MKPATVDEARAAKETLVERLGDDPAVRGIGIARRGDGHVVKVNLASDVVPREQPPTEIDGVTVVVEVVGEIGAL